MEIELSAGQKAVGVSFNPSQNPDVDKLKALFAQAFDIVERSVPSMTEDNTNEGFRKRKMRDAALHEIISAQMWAVKVITMEVK